MTLDVSSQRERPARRHVGILARLVRPVLVITSLFALITAVACDTTATNTPNKQSTAPVRETQELVLPGLDVSELIAVLCDPSDKDDARKRHAAILLGIVEHEPATHCLHQVLRGERNPSVRAAAVQAIARIGKTSSLPEIENALLDPKSQVRVAAVEALGQLGGASSLEPLAKIAKAKGPEALAALEALARTPQGRLLLKELPYGPADRFRQSLPAEVGVDARLWYVDASAGNDEGDGSKEKPFRSLGRAVRELRGGAGDQLLATSGDQGLHFHEEVSITPQHSGTQTRPTRIEAWPDRPAPILDGALPNRPGKPGLTTGIHVGASHVRIRGFTVRHFVENGISLNGSTGNVVEDCIVERCDRHGIFAYYSPSSTIVRPQVRGCLNQGISIRSSPYTAVLGGLSEDNGFDGLLLLQDSDNVLVSGLRAAGNKRGIAAISHSDGARLIDVSLHNNTQDDLYFDEDCPVRLINSTIGKVSVP